MNALDLKYLLAQSKAIDSTQCIELNNVLEDFPYFQSPRAIVLKSLFNQNNFKYNAALKKTAAYTTDRSVLFNYITSKRFKSLQNSECYNLSFVKDIEVKEFHIVGKNTLTEKSATTSLEESIIKSIIQADQTTLDTNVVITNHNPVSKKNSQESQDIIHTTSNIVEFNPEEVHSFTKWLQLTKMQPIDRSTNALNEIKNKAEEVNIGVLKENKFKIIDQFIAKNPKIIAVKEPTVSSINIEKSTEEKSYLMTETLAKIYLEQKKYTKAIQAYEILILKYPEKSSLFAERIKEIKKNQNNNN